MPIFFQITLIILLLQSCTHSATQGKQRSTSFDEVPNPAKNTSLFQNQKDKLYQFTPKDERKKDPKVDALLKTIEKAIKNKDLNLLFSVMDKDIISSYGGLVIGYDGIEETWENDYQQMWNRLDKVLAMGGSFVDDSSYSIPYTGDLDYEAQKLDEMIVPHGYGLTTNATAKIYPNASCRSKEGIQVGRTFAMVDVMSNYRQWDDKVIKVSLLSTGIHGYIKNEDFYISSDYLLHLEKNKQGNWKITAFAPWD